MDFCVGAQCRKNERGEIQMDKETLKQYRALKREINLIDKKLNRLYDRQQNIPEVIGKVTGSSKEFPYTEIRTTVRMAEPRESDQIKILIWKRQQRREVAERKLTEIENFISSIPDSDTRQIFEMIYIDGMKQREVSEKIGLERSGISKKIDGYLQLSHISQK